MEKTSKAQNKVVNIYKT